ncbi:MAG: OPT/YSL family transporter, partial [Candidatus Sericytochromatia bacterium]|nr:OPT/YSL family transporter [Candidatus Sericytochromatia bacterium]
MTTGEPVTKDMDPNLSVDETDRHWYENVYQGDHVPQLTVRSLIMGMLLGGFMSLSNLYVGLKTGWGLGVAITACILSYAIWNALHAVFPKWTKSEMSILENNAMQSTASSAGYSTGGTMVSTIAAYMIVTGHHMNTLTLTLWTFCLAILGVCMAIPMKRQMINVEQLRFPSGVAAATTLRSLHSKGAEALKQARSLFTAGGIGAVIAWFRDASASWMPFNIPGNFPIPFLKIGGQPALQYTIGFEGSLIMIAAGAIMGFKVAWSLLLGAVINYGFLAPYMHSIGAIQKLGYRGIVNWSMWTGAAIMVSSALISFAMQWRTVARAIRGAAGGASADGVDRPWERLEVPRSWFFIGCGLSGLACILILKFAFETSIPMGILSVLMTFFLALVACRATGETDTTPIGAMGKITQLTYGVLAPGHMVTNLMTAGVTAGAAGSAADLLTDLKSGYLLGANPRKQFLAQLAGVFAGTAIVVPAFFLLVPDVSVLGSDRFPAPAAQVWAGVAKLLSNGFASLHPTAQMGLLIGTLVGIAIPLIEKVMPEKGKKFVPSAMGLGLSMVIPAWNSISMFIGASIALVYERVRPSQAETYVIPVSSGIIAGESLMGVAVALLVA